MSFWTKTCWNCYRSAHGLRGETRKYSDLLSCCLGMDDELELNWMLDILGWPRWHCVPPPKWAFWSTFWHTFWPLLSLKIQFQGSLTLWQPCDKTMLPRWFRFSVTTLWQPCDKRNHSASVVLSQANIQINKENFLKLSFYQKMAFFALWQMDLSTAETLFVTEYQYQQ